MSKTWKVLSYVFTAALASLLTLALVMTVLIVGGIGRQSAETSKLDQLEALILDRFIGEADQTVMEDAAATAMVEALGDQWSYYIPAADYKAYQEQMANAYVGIGITITVMEDNSGFEIIKVNEGGSADEAGLKVGDLIVAVDGKPVAEMDANQARDMVRGEEGTFVEITIVRSGKERTFSVERKRVQMPVATAQLLEGNVGLITITNFDSRCADETITAIESLMEQGATSLIFDVRNNPGGYASELVAVLDHLLPEGPLFRTVDYAGNEDVDTSDAECLDIPMAVLVNGSSYSAAEFFAAALSEYEAAVVVGEKTCGKGYFQSTYELKDGSAVGLSIGKYFTPEGVSLADVGVTPDVIVEVDEETAAAIYAGTLDPMEDPQIQAAVEALSK